MRRWSFYDECKAESIGRALYWAARAPVVEILVDLEYDPDAGTVRIFEVLNGGLAGPSPPKNPD